MTVPANTTARILTPDIVAVRESGLPVTPAYGVAPGPAKAGLAVYKLPSGTYHFTAPLP